MKDDPDKRAAAAVTAEMQRQGLTLRALAASLGWDDSYLWRRTTTGNEAVPMSVSDLEALASALGTSIGALLSDRAAA